MNPDLQPLPCLASLILAYCAWQALSLAMDRHYADIHGRGAEPSVRQRRYAHGLGTLALVLALAVCVQNSGWGIGAVAWLGSMTIAALLLVLQLSYAPGSVMRCRKPAWVMALLMMLALCW
jgi:hypothetical protein